MRLLIVDNYDSFTFNLFQLAARVSGALPVVVRNDQVAWETLRRGGFGGVIVSPGPGRPERASDLGVGRDVIAEGDVPVLGVCLGHQAIAHAFGGRIVHGREPMHGRISVIHHDGSELFAGVPRRFEAVRYHSLVVEEPLPEDLVATAWSEDGTLMALRHRTRPLWGVQFHPESICSQHGEELLRSFVALASRSAEPRSDAPGRAVAVVPGALRRSSSSLMLSNAHEVRVRTLAPGLDAERVFDVLLAAEPDAVWLDSAIGGRFSFLGGPLGPLGQKLSYRAGTRELTITEPASARATTRTCSLFAHLEAELDRLRVRTPSDLPFDFVCGFAGYLGYELKSECGGEAKHDSPYPDAQLVLADRVVAFDHATSTTYLVALCETSTEARALADAWLDGTMDRLTRDGALAAPPVSAATSAAATRLCRESFWWTRELTDYASDIRLALEHLRDGESYEVCLTNRLCVKTDIEPLAFYRTLRRSNPAPHAAFLRFGDLAIASASPERFLRIDRDGVVEAKPIKGTAPRSEVAELDARLAEDLRTSEKTRSENLMIVDLLRNDLGSVCEIGSVDVPHLMHVESYATVHQLVTTIRGRLRDDRSAVDALRACFPGGSMTGAPKIRTMRIIDELERDARGVYSGAIGYLSPNGAADFGMVIRTAVFHGGEASIGAGGAVTALSNVDDEIEEMRLKSRALVDAMLSSQRRA